MKAFLKKLLVGKISKKEKIRFNPIEKRILNIRSIWNNDHQEDNGIEKIFRLFLSISQLLFPGIYIKYFANKKGSEYQDLALDVYILAKVMFPFMILINEWQHNIYIIFVMTYVLLETVLYIPTLIFASDLFSRPRSYKRSMLLLFFNYMEIVLAFAVLYSCGNYLNKDFTHWFDALYFSIITSSSIGYGDFYPVTIFGKFLVSMQALLFCFL
ncbi:potassium channel protein [Flavobacterium psychrophilum]|uniref:potassium channel family protein n=1 Tax=Flavobacterium psychrophilum TaxID=96345 RepID=UPI00076EF753|nr:potassium channel family protein [Flavobacterium psychrophilum]GAQ49470.1 potassium channel protein [Flavobacterium psychrophilum]GAW89618.1 potassium channel protein [Flavobacterium psychrophilum]